jgi:membrane protease YdiL (CAAX protease family)
MVHMNAIHDAGARRAPTGVRMNSTSTWQTDWDDPERRVRRHVHVALASILLGALAPLVSWALVIRDWRAPLGVWKRRLLALAIFDTLLVIALVVAASRGIDLRAASRPPRIGVELEETARGPVVVAVAPDGPAANALREGDRIVAVDGRRVEDGQSLVSAIERTPPHESRHLVVERASSETDVTVTPESGAPAPRTAPRPLFARRNVAGTPVHHVSLSGGVLALAATCGLIIAAWRKKARVRPGLVVLFALVVLAVVASATLVALESTIGASLGALLIALAIGSGSLVLVTLVAIRWMGLPRVPVRSRIGTPKAIGLGALYGATGMARGGVVVALFAATSGLPLESASDAFGVSSSWGPIGIGLFVIATVILAPIGEELLFRGILLGWLTEWMTPRTAVIWSAIVFGLGHLYYGLGALLITFFGLVLGWARLRTGGLRAPIVLHALLNGTTAAALLLS